MTVAWWSVIPFAVLLLSIAILPLVPATAHAWEHNRTKLAVALACGLPVAVWFVVAGHGTEVDELAATAPDELSGQLTSVREAVAGFRQGERSFISVVQEVRGLQERCSG